MKFYTEEQISFPNLPFPPTPKKGEQDAYTPDDADQTQNLEDFEPDFKKPLRVTYKSDIVEKEFTTGEGEQMTPIKTDNVLEEDEDAQT